MKSDIWRMFLSCGWLTKRGRLIFFLLGWVLMTIPFWLASKGILNFNFAFILFCLGLLLGLVVGYEGKARQFGFQAPFTNDPLGWRAAKKSYAKPDRSDEEGDQSS